MQDISLCENSLFLYTVKSHLVDIIYPLISEISLKIHFNYLANDPTYNFSQNFRTMKLIKYFFFLPASIVLLLLSCNHTVTNLLQSGNWVSRTESPGDGRTQAACFVVGDTAYIGTGYYGTYNIRLNDFWAFALNGGWYQVASTPTNTADSGNGRNGAAAFAIGRNGYITTGTNGYNMYTDTWAYNVDNNTWSQAASFPSTGRYGASAFTINSSAYVTCGYDNQYKKDNYQFTPSPTTNGCPGSWAQMADIGIVGNASGLADQSQIGTSDVYDVNAVYSAVGYPRNFAIAFVHTSPATPTNSNPTTYGYLVTGLGQSGTNVNDFYQFVPPNTTYNTAAGYTSGPKGTWLGLKEIQNVSTESFDDDYSDIVRNSGVGFVMGDSAYITVGINGGYTQKTWVYQFSADQWTRKTSFERVSRGNGVAFVIGGRGFVSSGNSGSTYYFDLEEWQPYIALNTND